jgi:PAS domain S-box-containing protein
MTPREPLTAQESAATIRVLSSLGPEQLASLIDGLPVESVMCDRDMHVLKSSRRWRDAHQLGETDPTGRSYYDLVPGTPERWREAHRRILGGAAEPSHEETVEHADGTIDWVRWEGRPWYEPSGQVGGAVLFSEIVTDRHRSEARDERYRVLARHGRDLMLFVRRADGRILEANDAALAAYGYTQDEITERSIQDLRAPGTFQLTSAQMSEADAQGVLFETIHRRKDGSEFPVEVSSQGATIGGVRMLLSIVRDITRRRQNADELVASEQRYKDLVQLSPDAILVHRDRIVEFVNPAAVKLFAARDAGELLGRDWLTLFHPDCHAAVREHIARLGRDESTSLLERRIVRQDGVVVDVELASVWFAERQGRARQVLLRDLTDRKRHEAAAREVERAQLASRSEARFRALIERSLDLLLVVDAEGRITFWSPGAQAALGWTEAEAAGRHSSDFLHPADLDAAKRHFLEAASRPGAVVQHASRLRHKDGSWRYVETTARNLLGDPDVQGVVLNGRDVTVQRELQRNFLEAQKLESIGRLAGGVAHDFNNLLTAILGGSEALGDALDSGTLVHREDVDAIHQAGERARELTRQLLSFARREVIAPAPLDVNQLVRDTGMLLRRLLPENVRIENDLEDGLGLVLGDLAQLQQVIVNLSVNARDAMPEGGTLSLSTRASEFDAAAATAAGLAGPCPCVRLVVSDDGIGMDEHVRAHLFEPFFTTKPQGRGTGLGLPAVYGIVTQNHGRITVDSLPGRGTTIAIDLPCTERAAERVEEVAVDGAGGSETILLVEDEPLVREITARALRKAGYRVLAASGSAEALAATDVNAERIDLLVSDVVMPGMNGPELAGRLVARHPTLNVLFVSGYAPEAMDRDGVLRAGVEFLQKPFRMSALLARVRGLLDAARAQPR